MHKLVEKNLDKIKYVEQTEQGTVAPGGLFDGCSSRVLVLDGSKRVLIRAHVLEVVLIDQVVAVAAM